MPPNPWFSSDYLRDNADSLLAALGEHVFLTVATVVIATLIAIPLAVLASHVRWLGGPVLTVTGAIYTIPSLALFAFLAPFTGVTATTVLIGLVLYALILIVRNSLTGLQQVPGELREVGLGMGYGKFSLLWKIELPLALPGIVTGLRLATVSTVALVTVGDIVGVGGLGNLIMAGFRNNFYRAQIMTASVLCVVLALILDLLLVIAARRAMPWARKRAMPA